jgi:hypothetical protein
MHNRAATKAYERQRERMPMVIVLTPTEENRKFM